MKIVDRRTFLAMPAGIVFSKYQPMYFGDLMIKGESTPNDFCYQDISGAVACEDSGEFCDILERAEKTGVSIALDFDCQARDGLYDKDQLFAIWEPDDVRALITRLEDSMRESSGAKNG